MKAPGRTDGAIAADSWSQWEKHAQALDNLFEGLPLIRGNGLNDPAHAVFFDDHRFSLGVNMESGIYAILGAVVGGAMGVLSTWLSLIYTNRRHRREVCFNAGIETWKRQTELAIQSNKGYSILPPEDFILSMLIYSDEVLKHGSIKTDDLVKRVLQVENKIREVSKARRYSDKMHS